MMIENRTRTITRKQLGELSERLFQEKTPDQIYNKDTFSGALQSLKHALQSWSGSEIQVTCDMFNGAWFYMQQVGKKLPRAGNEKCNAVEFFENPDELLASLRIGTFGQTGGDPQFNSDSTMTIRVTEGWNLHFLALDHKTDTPIAERTYLIKPGANAPHREFQETIALEIYDALRKIYSEEILSQAGINNPMSTTSPNPEPMR